MADDKAAKGDERTKAEDKARSENSAAVAGAQAVADAVAKVANAAVAEVQKTKAATGQDLDFDISGSPGGRFTIRGVGFRASGTVLIGGKQVETTGWSNETIYGKLPADAKAGEVTVWVDEKTQLKGYLRV